MVTASVFVAIVLTTGLLHHVHYNDENFYNRLNAYYATQPVFTPLHDSANQPISIGPTFFIVHRVYSGLFGSGNSSARSLSLLLMIAAFACWTSIAVRLYRQVPPALIAAFWILPFHGVFATCVLAESFMMAFQLAGIRLWMATVDHSQTKSLPVRAVLCTASGICLGLALNSKTPLLPAAVALVLIGSLRLRNAWCAAAPLIAILMQMPFWMQWGNIFPPGQRVGMMPQFAHLSGLFPDTLIHLLAVAGTALWPAFRFDRRSRTDVLTLSAGVLLWFTFGPGLEPSDESRYRFAGPILQASYLGTFVRCSIIIPFLAGWQVFCISIRHLIRNDIDILRQAFLAAAVISILAFLRSPLAFDRYAACFLPLWWLAFWPEIRRYPQAMALSFIPLFLENFLLLEKILNSDIVFASPLPHLAGF